MKPKFETAENFYFATPLYSICTIEYDAADDLLVSIQRVDGWCPYCGRERTFTYIPANKTRLPHDDDGRPHFRGIVTLKCTKDSNHSIAFTLQLASGNLQKVGQYPSFASIAQDQSKQYVGLLGKEYSAEFHKAIGLAAHGVGIGSYVYMRRIFERLIQSRYEEFKEVEGWSDDEFRNMKMADRIQHLKGHLPEFLVRNTKLYSIMSRGVHELDEEACLAFFPIIKGAIIVILEEDKRKREELARQKEYEKAIAAFTAKEAPVGVTETKSRSGA